MYLLSLYKYYHQVYDPDIAPLEINVGEIVHLLAKEEELVAARTKAENLERENVDLATELAKKVLSIGNFNIPVNLKGVGQ